MIFDKLHEECAVFGASLKVNEAAVITHNGLVSLQHRGQESAGIAVLVHNTILYHKDIGLVTEVFTPKVLNKLPKSTLAVGHTRYSTTGSSSIQNVQPFITEFLTGRIATVHNGNLTNALKIRESLQGHGLDFVANSDSEVISSLIAYKAMKSGNIISAVIEAVKMLEGAFSVVIMSNENKLIAVRDPHGFRPLCLGKSEAGIIVASESCAVDGAGFDFVRDVEPGEIVIIEDGEIVSSQIFKEDKNAGLCIFEHVYFARPDTHIDGQSVYNARFNMGRALAKEHPVKADVVCGVPDSGLEAAQGYAHESGIKLVSGFFKNRYIGRSFILPSQKQRETAVRFKLNPLRSNVEGKSVVLVDDSIVRGTTCAKIISALRGVGAREVHLRISSPPFRHMCYFGTDIDSEENLIANQMSVEEICKKIGADSLGYISLDGLKGACNDSRLPFCVGCFTGDYGVKISKESKLVKK